MNEGFGHDITGTHRGLHTRSALFLAGIRALIALLFAAWLWIAPPPAVFGGVRPVLIFVAYLHFALAMLAVAWRSWWLEFRLAGLAFCIDTLTMLVGLAATEAITLDFFSAFMTFYAFLTLTSVARWRRRNALFAALGLALCFLLVSLGLEWAGVPFDTTKALRRLSTLGVLSLVFAWFALGRQHPTVPRCVPVSDEDVGSHHAAVLAYAMCVGEAGGGLLAWTAAGDAQPHVVIAGNATMPADPPTLPLTDEAPMLFDRLRGHTLALASSGRLFARSGVALGGLLAAGDAQTGLAIPLSGRTGQGLLVLFGLSHLNADDLFLGQALAREVAAAIDDAETRTMAREVAMARLRGQIATDLHDSVVQTLAGARFRLEALRLDLGSPDADSNISGQQDLAARDIADICQSIATEQDHVRAIIAQLRQGQILPGQRDLRAEIAALAQQLSRHWHVTVTLTREAPLPMPAGLVYECQHFVREAVANAVRHGSANTITLILEQEAGRLQLVIADDGRGFAGPRPCSVPASLATRAAALRGDLTLASDPGQTRLVITLPLDMLAVPAPTLTARTVPGASS